MTANTATRSAANPAALLLLAALPVLFGAFLALNLLGATVRERPEHTAKHGAEVAEIHAALSCDGPLATFRNLSWKRPDNFFHVCRLRDGQFGVMIADRLKDGRWLEVTTFLLGSAARAKEYLSARAQLVTGVAPWEVAP